MYFSMFSSCKASILSCFHTELNHPFSIDVFEDYIYGITYINNYVFRVNKFGKGHVENLTTGMNHATDLVLYHRNKQPESELNCSKLQQRGAQRQLFKYQH